jgi:hypothetical protein
MDLLRKIYLEKKTFKYQLVEAVNLVKSRFRTTVKKI